MADEKYYDASTNKWKVLKTTKSTPNTIATNVITTMGLQDLSTSEAIDLAIKNGEPLSTTLSKIYSTFVKYKTSANEANKDILALIGNLKESSTLLQSDYTLVQEDSGKLITCNSSTSITVNLPDNLKTGSSFSIINTGNSDVLIKTDADKILRYNKHDELTNEIKLDAGDRIVLSTDGSIWYEFSSVYAKLADSANNDDEGNKISTSYLKLSGGTVTGPVTIKGTTKLGNDTVIVDAEKGTTAVKGDITIGSSPANSTNVVGNATFSNDLTLNGKGIFKGTAEFVGSSDDKSAPKLVISNDSITFTNGTTTATINAEKYTGMAETAAKTVGKLTIAGKEFDGSEDLNIELKISDIHTETDKNTIVIVDGGTNGADIDNIIENEKVVEA